MLPNLKQVLLPCSPQDTFWSLASLGLRILSNRLQGAPTRADTSPSLSAPTPQWQLPSSLVNFYSSPKSMSIIGQMLVPPGELAKRLDPSPFRCASVSELLLYCTACISPEWELTEDSTGPLYFCIPHPVTEPGLKWAYPKCLLNAWMPTAKCRSEPSRRRCSISLCNSPLGVLCLHQAKNQMG